MNSLFSAIEACAAVFFAACVITYISGFLFGVWKARKARAVDSQLKAKIEDKIEAIKRRNARDREHDAATDI